MASSTTQKPVQKLGELLQEQQEPFTLEAYLLERRYPEKSLNSDHGNSCKFLKREVSCNCSLNKGRKGAPHCFKKLRAVYKKLVKGSVVDKRRNKEEVAEHDRFSVGSNRTVFNTCSERDAEEAHTSWHKDQTNTANAITFQALKLQNLREKEAAAERKLRGRCMEDSKLLSPVSVLDEIPSHEGSPLQAQPKIRKKQEGENPSTSRIFLPRKITEDSILSASLWELLLHSEINEQDPSCAGFVELRKEVRSNPCPQYWKSKRVLQQTRQLLFDCVREVVETHGRKDRSQQSHIQILWSEELGRVILEKMKGWSKQCGDETNISLQLDFLESAEEWSDFHKEKRDIGLAIGDEILEEVMNEIVTGMID